MLDFDAAARGLRNLWSLTLGDGIAPVTTPSTPPWPPVSIARCGATPTTRRSSPRARRAAPRCCSYHRLRHPPAATTSRSTIRSSRICAPRAACPTSSISARSATPIERWIADFITDIIPEAIGRVLDDFGARQVDLYGWSLGGTLSLLTAAPEEDRRVRSIVTIATPLDYNALPGYPLARVLNRPPEVGRRRVLRRSVASLHPWSRSPIVQRRGTARYANRGSSPRTSPSRTSWRAWKRSTASSASSRLSGPARRTDVGELHLPRRVVVGVLDFDGLTVDRRGSRYQCNSSAATATPHVEGRAARHRASSAHRWSSSPPSNPATSVCSPAPTPLHTPGRRSTTSCAGQRLV